MSNIQTKFASWEVVTLGAVCAFKGGSGFKESFQGRHSGEYPFIKVSDLNLPGNEKYVFHSNNWVSTAELKLLKATLQPIGATVFAKVGAALKLNRRRVLVRPTVIDNNMMAAIPEETYLNREYLYYFMLGEDLGRFCQESAVPSINQGHLESIQIPLPPLAEQRKIAEILRTWDEAIETAEAELKAKQERKRWLAMRLISGESRLSGCSGKWEKVRLADLFERVMQKNEELCERCLTISAEKGLVDQREYFDRRISSADTSGYFLMKRGDFAYNRSYSNGYPYGVVKRLNDYDVGTVTTLYLVFTPRNRTFDPLYMEHVFDSGILNKGLRTIVQEGARAHGLLNVKAEDFFSLVVNIPDLNEQSKISKLLSDAQTQITDCESHLELLRNQKRGLMQKLLTGEVRVAA